MSLTFDLLHYQADFVTDLTSREIALVGGRGSGKSEAVPPKALALAMANPGFDGAILSPTGPMATKVLIPRMRKYLDAQRRIGALSYTFNKTERRFEIKFPWTKAVTTVYVLSAENVRDGLGLNLAWFGIDEADTMDTTMGFEVWRKLNLAVRVGNKRQAFAVSTPEGYGWMYKNWVADITPRNALKRRLIKARSEDNIFLPRDELENIRASYPAHMVDAYMNGEFVNMASGSVYPGYEPDLNHTNHTWDTIRQSHPHAAIHIGLDFNVVNEVKHPYGIFAVVAVMLNNRLFVIDEIYGDSQITKTISRIRHKYGNRPIYIYPDASSQNSNTVTTESARQLLQDAGFIDEAPLGNPKVGDRVDAVNAQFLSINGDRRMHVNKDTCPVLSRCLVQQPYDDNGSPQKDTGYDDATDALGYMVNVLWPIPRGDLSSGRVLI